MVSPQAQEALGEAAQELAGSGERGVARGALEERLADFLFQFVNGVADGGLGAAHADGAREKPFLRRRRGSFELVKVHKA